MRHFNKKWLAALMALCLTLSLAPTALMEETEPAPEAAAEIVASEPAAEPEAADDEADEEPEAVVVVESIDEPATEAVFDLGEADEEVPEVYEAELELVESDPAYNIVEVEFDSNYFPDGNLRAFLSSYLSDYDLDNSGGLSAEERNAVQQIILPHEYSVEQDREVCPLKVESLKGLEYFPELTDLDCTGNELVSIDLSGNKHLQTLTCSDNKLSGANGLIVSGNPELRDLYCGDNQLTALDISGNPELISLYCNNNQLTALDISKNTKLENFNAGGNALTSIDFSNNAGLKYLYCYGNQLTTLDVSKNTELEGLDCSNNKLTALDVSVNTKIDYLSCELNEIATLDISDLPKLAPYVADGYKREENERFVVYAQSVIEEDGISYYSGGILYCDKATKVITTKPAPAAVEAPAPAPAPAPVTPTIAATKKSSKTKITAAPGTFYQLDLGGSTGRKFRSSKKKVATVDSTGLVTVRGAGKTKITFKVGKKKRTVTLTVKDPTVPTSIALNLSGIQAAQVGEPQTLTATLPEGTTSGIKWKSSNKRIATVKNGVVTFKRAGKVTITATTSRGKKKAKVKFKVSK